MAAPITVWRTLALVYRRLDVSWRDGLKRRTSRYEMGAEEVAALRGVLDGVPGAVVEWSEGNASLEPFDVKLTDRPLTTMTLSGPGRWWIAPDDCRQELDVLAPEGRYDSIIVIWGSDGAIPLCGWGCSIGPSRAANGAGFSSIVNDAWRGYGQRLHPEEGFVHEWLHQVEAVYRELGVDGVRFPTLHEVEGRTSCRSTDLPPFGAFYPEYERQTGTWQPWYRDLMTGTVRPPDGGPCQGMTSEAWALRGR
ncbi:MAG TPA: hypothetical protein VH720_12225 [Candidatus Limnocylindrales bacterium]